MKRFIFVLVYTIFVCFWGLSPARAETWNTESYAEVSTLEGEGGHSDSAWARARWLIGASPFIPVPYLGVAWDRYAPDQAEVSRISPMVGAEIFPLPSLKVFAEYRYVTETPRSTYSKSDPRVGLIGGLWRELPLGGRWALISDSYGEFILVSRISSNPGLTAFSKAGPRVRLAKGLSADLYGEAYARDNDDVNLGRRSLELRYGTRAVYSFAGPRNGGWSASLAAFRRVHTFRDAPEARWRLLLAVGGTL